MSKKAMKAQIIKAWAVKSAEGTVIAAWPSKYDAECNVFDGDKLVRCEIHLPAPKKARKT